MTTRRYEPLVKIASGGTATVYVGRASGALGFRQLVAIKRPHEHLAEDPAFRAALVAEAMIAARLRHANVVDVRDVEADERGVQLVMDYVEGASLSEMIRSWTKVCPARAEAVAIRVVLDACEGLRAVHEATGDDGALLGLVHRDISPANVLVGLDGVARIADFGLAKPLLAVERSTTEGTLRGKLGYMAPEYVRGKPIDLRIDVFAMGVVTWEAIARRRLFRGGSDGETLDRVQTMEAPSLGSVRPSLGEVGPALDAVVARALAKDPASRFDSIVAFSSALEEVARAHGLSATPADVRDAFGADLREALEERRRQVNAAEERGPRGSVAPISVAPIAAPASMAPIAVAPASVAPASVAPASVAPASVAPPTVAPASEAPIVVAPSSTSVAPMSVEAPRSVRTRLVVAGAVALSAAVAIALLVVTRDQPAPPSSERSVVASDVSPLDDVVRRRAPHEPDPSASAARGHGRPKKPRPSDDATGSKPPRPNPYATSSAPR